MSAQSENFIASLVHSGVLEVRSDGSIWRLQTRTRVGRSVRCNIRADHKAAKGYRGIAVSISGVRYDAMAHRVIWIFYNGPVPNGDEINHIDGVRDNNRPVNLEPLSHSANQKHAYDFLGRTRCYGSRNGSVKLSEEQVAAIRAQKGESSSRAVGFAFNVSHRQVLNIWNFESRNNGFPDVRA